MQGRNLPGHIIIYLFTKKKFIDKKYIHLYLRYMFALR